MIITNHHHDAYTHQFTAQQRQSFLEHRQRRHQHCFSLDLYKIINFQVRRHCGLLSPDPLYLWLL